MQEKALSAEVRQWLGTNAPRYTSYPTAPHFNGELPEETYAGWLRALPEGTALSLYLHIPFCQEMCWYCGCTTSVTRRYEPVERYLFFLLREISQVAEHLGEKRRVTHLHFGGGSPSLLRAEDMQRLMEALRKHFDVALDAEIAVEIDPRGFDAAKAASYADLGVNRASLGVQDFSVRTQEAIHRVQPYAQVAETVRLLRMYGIEAISFDLLYGLPHQTVDFFARTVAQALTLAPSRFAVFSYAHVPWMKKHQRLIDIATLPSEEEKLVIFSAARAQLEAAGYMMIGMDHFAQPEDAMAVAYKNRTLHRNFQGYTTDGAGALIGFGLSSIGDLPQGYVQNSTHSTHYRTRVEEGRLPVERGLPVTAEDRLRRAVINTLMCYMDVDVGAICVQQGFAESFLDSALDALAPLVESGVVRREDRFIALNTEYRMAVRAVCTAFDAYFATGEARYSRVA